MARSAGRPAKNPERRRQLLARGDLDGWIAAKVPGPMLLEVQREAAHELVSVAELVRKALREKFERERREQNRQEMKIKPLLDSTVTAGLRAKAQASGSAP